MIVALLLASAQASAVEPAYAPLEGGDWAHGMWADGAGSLYVVQFGRVYRLGRGEARADYMGGALAGISVSGTGQGEDAVVVVASRSGEVVRFQGGDREDFEVYLPYEGELVTALPLRDGRVVCVCDRHALFVLDGEVVEQIAYPDSGMRVKAAAAGPDGAVFLVGAGGLVLRFSGSAVLRVVLTSEGERFAAELLTAWVSPDSGMLWSTTSGDSPVRIDPRNGSVETWTIPVDGTCDRLHGAATKDGDVVALGCRERFALFQEGLYRILEVRQTFPSAVHLDLAGLALYITGSEGLRRVSVLDAFDGPDSTRLDGEPPSGPEVERSFRVGLRIAMGPAWHLSELSEQFDADAHFNLDLVGTVRVTFGRDMRGVTLYPELGYTYDDLASGGHLAAFGLGLGYGHPWISVGWVPRFVVGGLAGDLALGLRHGLVADLGMGIFCLELSHQVLWAGGETVHDLRLNFGIDLYTLTFVVLRSWALDELDLD